MRFKTMNIAKKQAKANANLTNVPWVVFFDTSLCPNVERFNKQSIVHRSGQVFEPTHV